MGVQDSTLPWRTVCPGRLKHLLGGVHPIGADAYAVALVGAESGDALETWSEGGNLLLPNSRMAAILMQKQPWARL